ncbi:hypothetical protein [Ensifer aridi]|uniref:hypothetical protein n=1 Tax=Ensifer aridi TaxID=1708715 RepID=UPI000A10DF13
MISVAHSPRDLLAGNRTDVECLVRAYVWLWLFDRWLRHIRRHVWREFRVIRLRNRGRRHSGLLFDSATDTGLCLFQEERLTMCWDSDLPAECVVIIQVCEEGMAA